MLCALSRRPGQLLTKNALLDEVWGHQHVSESVLKTTISQLRAALADDAASPRYIETASRLGYRFIGTKSPAPVAVLEVEAAPSGAMPFIGRRVSLSRLHDAWRRAGSGQRQLVWVAGDAGAYRYLAESIRLHPDQALLADMLRSAGLSDVEVFNLAAGVVAIHRGYRF